MRRRRDDRLGPWSWSPELLPPLTSTERSTMRRRLYLTFPGSVAVIGVGHLVGHPDGGQLAGYWLLQFGLGWAAPDLVPVVRDGDREPPAPPPIATDDAMTDEELLDAGELLRLLQGSVRLRHDGRDEILLPNGVVCTQLWGTPRWLCWSWWRRWWWLRSLWLRRLL